MDVYFAFPFQQDDFRIRTILSVFAENDIKVKNQGCEDSLRATKDSSATGAQAKSTATYGQVDGRDDGRGLFSSFSCFHFAERSCFANFAHQIQRRALRRGKNRTIWQPFLVSVQSHPQHIARVRIYMVSMARYGALSVRTFRAPSLLH